MTEGQAIELGKRAMAAGWKWQAGAANTFGWRVLKAGAQVLRVDTGDHGELLWREDTDAGIPDFRDAATLGTLRQQVLALVPGAVEVALARLFSATMPRTHSVMWRDNRGVTVRQMQFALTWDERWPIETLVACLEAAKKGDL